MNRFAVNSRMPINYNSDCSLAFRSQRPFNLCMRMYTPKGNDADRQMESAGNEQAKNNSQPENHYHKGCTEVKPTPCSNISRPLG